MSSSEKMPMSAADASRPRVLSTVATGGSPFLEHLDAARFDCRHIQSTVDIAHVTRSWQPTVVLLDSLTAQMAATIKGAHPCICLLVVPEVTAHFLNAALDNRIESIATEPVEAEGLLRLLAREFRESTAATRSHRSSTISVSVDKLIGDGPEMKDVWRRLVPASASDATVLITGETGVGKEMVARALHLLSPRRSGPFIAVNCAAIPETLVESELFGHEKGAFTGAASRHAGRFELANRGTLFLDEIGELPLLVQAKLLRVLQERTFERVGGAERVATDVRIVAATNRNLAADITDHRFRADLYYRLNVVALHIPSLRERKADIAPLWDNFIATHAEREGRAVPRTEPNVRRLLLRHSWPGNIRELQNAVRHALAAEPGEIITTANLPKDLVDEAPVTRGKDLVGLTMEEIERVAIVQTHAALGSVKMTAEALGISERTVYYRLKKYRSQVAASLPVKRVLLAEDSDEIRWALSDLIKREGFEVVEVSTGAQLLEHLGSSLMLEKRDVPADIVVTDIRLPGVSGMRLLEFVRERGWDIPVVIISAFGDAETRRRAEELGAMAFLDKPIDLQSLQNVLIQAANHAPSSDLRS